MHKINPKMARSFFEDLNPFIPKITPQIERKNVQINEKSNKITATFKPKVEKNE